MKKFLFVACALMLLSGCSGLPTEKIHLQTKNGPLELTVEIAHNRAAWEQGLMGRKKLDEGRGMWFIFPEEAPRSFWMKNTLIPLDIIYFDSEKRVVSIVEGMQPCERDPCRGYFSEVPALFALEVPGGYVRKHGVGLKDRVTEE